VATTRQLTPPNLNYVTATSLFRSSTPMDWHHTVEGVQRCSLLCIFSCRFSLLQWALPCAVLQSFVRINWTWRCCGQQSCFVFVRPQVRISTRRPVIWTEAASISIHTFVIHHSKSHYY